MLEPMTGTSDVTTCTDIVYMYNIVNLRLAPFSAKIYFSGART